MEPPPTYSPPPTRLSPQDFETASIRSAAPSYISEAPPYSSSLPSYQSIPRSPPSASSSSSPRRPSLSPLHPHARTQSLTPSLDQFRIPTWSTTTSNPTARHYHSVAHRRATIASAATQQEILQAALSGADPLQTLQARLLAESLEKLKPLEDPYLVGEEAAERARMERLARENGMAVLIRENQRWDWLLSQMGDWEERERSWSKFRKELEGGKRGKLARRLGLK